MRQVQIVMLALGTAFLIASAFGIGRDFGETLYRTGIAFLFVDVVCLQLWPRAQRVSGIPAP